MKTMTIEELASWAFVHELPKGGGVDGLDNANSAWRMLEATSWGRINSFAELMTLVDGGRRDHENFFIEQGAPHDDALAVGEAVAGLARCEAIIPEGWAALADWPDTGGLAEAAVARVAERYRLRPFRQRAASLMSLVIGTAVLGKRPDWSAPVSKVRMVERGGRPAWFVEKAVTDVFGRRSLIEVDGLHPRSRRPVRGAYRKYELSDDPTGDILSRLDWQLWVAAMRYLEGNLALALVAHRFAPFDERMTPWLSHEGAGVRLLELAGAAKN
ncbi:hypothetical protein GRZ55_11265 [Chelativorans sp. ZYF759]|uniref:hypothetical protein n=1 Tax=Chelativorans sp. ZYF759 TaxID=2692213 RepID=UPI00145DE8FD|nr:hypothetical protein [Chelativorans sp. ZYF759]NMG39823.1 hypothetical protein [Chelativorans sp. ZYF759]